MVFKYKMPIVVNYTGGFYVASSLPKPLMVPLRSMHQKSIKSDLSDKPKKISSIYSENVLYTKAHGTSIKQPANVRCSTEYGDSEHPPVFGRQHITVQTDLYLEELCDVIDEKDEECQTDPLLDRPSSPLFVPAKIGVDVATQIYPGELFDFDVEVQPILETLVGQTLEQALIEVIAEEEVALLIDQQKEYEARRNAELAERQRLEEQERRILEEKRRRLQEQEQAIKLEEETAEKIAACVFSQNFLSNLLPSVYRRLEIQGYFATQEPEVQEIEEDFWPWLMDEVDNEIITLEASCYFLDSLIEESVETLTATSILHPVDPDVYPELEMVALTSQDEDEGAAAANPESATGD